MTMIAGLGNPGAKYDGTRHNAGFETLDILAKENDFPLFSSPGRAKFEASEGIIDGRKTVLVKPLTFMNLSGIGVREALAKFGRDDCRLILVHDDIDISLGEIRVSKNRGPGGHNGVASVIKELGTKNFTRVRIGILPERKPEMVNVFVLRKPPEAERAKLREAMNAAVAAVMEEIKKAE